MLIQNVALVAESDGPSFSALVSVAAALQTQVTRDLLPLWGVTATVEAFARREDVPLGYWSIVVAGDDPSATHGVRLNYQGQPHARVAAGPDWSLRASSACLDMLVNPHETRSVVGPSPRTPGALVEFLLEVSGPCTPSHGYLIQNVLVSDFTAPAFYGLQRSNQSVLSVAGSVAGPLLLAPGGHLTWRDAVSREWWLSSYWGDGPVDARLGTLDWRTTSVREFVQAWRSHSVAKGFSEPCEFAAEVIEVAGAATDSLQFAERSAARATLLPPAIAGNAVRVAEVEAERASPPPLGRRDFDRTTHRSHTVRDSVSPVSRSMPPALARASSRRVVGLLLCGVALGGVVGAALNGKIGSASLRPIAKSIAAGPPSQSSVAPERIESALGSAAAPTPAAKGSAQPAKSKVPASNSTSSTSERGRKWRAAAGPVVAAPARRVGQGAPTPESGVVNADAEIEALSATRR